MRIGRKYAVLDQSGTHDGRSGTSGGKLTWYRTSRDSSDLIAAIAISVYVSCTARA
jgi:hypothetical protein